MRICQRGWEFAQIWGKDGDVSVCSWATINFKPSIGKLSENTIEEIWHGEDAKLFRESLIDGSYRYCEKEKCPWMANGTLEEHMKEYDGVLEYPRDVALAFERNCNYNCTCCIDRNNTEANEPDAKDKRVKIKKEISKFLNDATSIGANGRGELFVSNDILQMLHDWKPTAPKEDIHVTLETNGVLFDEEHWKQIENLGQYDLKVAITIMGFDERTYQFLSGCKYPISKLESSLRFVKSLREKEIVNDFEIGTVIQERNFREMPELTRRCIEEFGVDRIRHRPYFPWGDRWDLMAKWMFDVRNPYHPYFSEYKEIFADPIFKHPKVLMWAGDELSKQGRNPYEKDKANFDVIKWFATDEKIPDKLQKYFDDKCVSNIAVYGWGFTGEALMKALEKTNLKLNFIIDKVRCGEKRGCVDVINKDDLKRDYDGCIVVTSPFYFEEIKNEITNEVLKNKLINIETIMCEIE